MPPTVHDLAAHDLLIAFVADRLDRLVDRLIATGGRGVAIAGRRAHLAWLHEHVWAMGQLPVTAYVCPDAAASDGPGAELFGAPIRAFDDLAMHEASDALLIADDRFQQALYDEALLHVPPRVLITRLYDRLPIGREPMAAMLSGTPGVVVRPAAPGGATRAGAAVGEPRPR